MLNSSLDARDSDISGNAAKTAGGPAPSRPGLIRADKEKKIVKLKNRLRLRFLQHKIIHVQTD